MMKINCPEPFPVSLDNGLTVTDIGPGEVDVPEWVAKIGCKYYGAKKIKETAQKGK